MICKRCGTPCDDADRFCRCCGKRFIARPSFAKQKNANTEDVPRHTEKSAQKTPLSTKKKWGLFTCFALLLFLTAFALILLPKFKQSFMSPAAYYLESEANEIAKFSNSTQNLINDLYSPAAQTMRADDIRLEAEGEDYADIAPLLDDLHLSVEFINTNKGEASLLLSAAYGDEKAFSNFLASVIGDQLTLGFPDMTRGEVAAKISTALQNSAKGTDDALQSITGYTRQELLTWVCSVMEPILFETLENSEQTLGFSVVDGKKVSTVTFHLTQDATQETVRKFSSHIRRDETLPKILKNVAAYITTSAEFRRDLAAEFNLTAADLDAFPLLSKQIANSPSFEMPPKETLWGLLNSNPTEEDVRAYVETLCDTIFDFAENVNFPNGINLTAYYQGTDLIGRSLREGTSTIFECFRYRRDGNIILDVNFEHQKQVYHLLQTIADESGKMQHELTFSRRIAELKTANIDPAATDKAESREEILFALKMKYEKRTSVGNVPVLLGNCTVRIQDTTYTITHEKVHDTATSLFIEKKSFNEEGLVNRLRLRANLSFSAVVDAQKIRVNASSDFGTPAFQELVRSLKLSLQDHAEFEHIFGEGALERFLAEEELRLQETGVPPTDDSEGETEPKTENRI